MLIEAIIDRSAQLPGQPRTAGADIAIGAQTEAAADIRAKAEACDGIDPGAVRAGGDRDDAADREIDIG